MINNLISSDPNRPLLRAEYLGPENEYRETVYRQGRLVYVDKTTLPVTFVFYKSYESADYAFKTGARAKEGKGLVRTWSIGEDGEKGTPVVSFDQFRRFLAEVLENFDLESKKFPGQLSKAMQQLIQDLIEAFTYAQSLELSSLYFDDPRAYVWIGDKVRLFRLDRVYDDEIKSNPDAAAWAKERDIYHFGQLLAKYILVKKKGIKLPDLDAFIELFDVASDPVQEGYVKMTPERRLKMLRKHTILKTKLPRIFDTVGSIKRCFGLPDGHLGEYNKAGIVKRLQDPEVFTKICPNQNWEIELSPVFKTYLNSRKSILREENKVGDHVALGEEIKSNNVFSLITWTRNPYEHGALEWAFLYEEARKKWPKLFASVHETLQHFIIEEGEASTDASSGA